MISNADEKSDRDQEEENDWGLKDFQLLPHLRKLMDLVTGQAEAEQWQHLGALFAAGGL